MKYPKRSQYKHAKKKKYRIRNWGAYTEALPPAGSAAAVDTKIDTMHPIYEITNGICEI